MKQQLVEMQLGPKWTVVDFTSSVQKFIVVNANTIGTNNHKI